MEDVDWDGDGEGVAIYLAVARDESGLYLFCSFFLGSPQYRTGVDSGLGRTCISHERIGDIHSELVPSWAIDELKGVWKGPQVGLPPFCRGWVRFGAGFRGDWFNARGKKPR